MRYFWSLLLLGIAADGSRLQLEVQSIPTFASFVQTYKRTYKADSAEYAQRKALYEARRADAVQHNNKVDRLWSAGVNKIWDWTTAEISQLNGRLGRSSMTRGGGGKLAAVHASKFLSKNHSLSENSTLMTAKTAPSAKDWKHLDVTKNIPDQGSCGSCWAVAASTVLQAHVQIYMNKTRTFAVQEMVNCIPNPQECGGQGGCRGATLELAMDYALKNGCSQTHETPYEAKDLKCTKPFPAAGSMVSGAAFGMTGWEKLAENKYEPLLLAMQDGPVGVSVAASDWYKYSTGIFDGCTKDAIVNHAVAMVAYGEENGVKYWTIQNSWGEYWGEQGNMRLLRHEDDKAWCGIDNDPQAGSGCKGGPPEVPVCGMCGILYDSVVPHFK
jgi:cathepsin L